MTRQELHEYVMSFDHVSLAFPYGNDTSVYLITRDTDSEGKLFVIVQDTTQPLRISLRCDPNLAIILREKYETVLPGQNLNKKTWNTVINTGQVTDDELKGFIHISYQQTVA